MQTETASEVWGRIQTLAHENPGGIIATDGDGTLWSGDVGEDLFHAFLDGGRVLDPALDAIRLTAREHALSDAGSGPDVARRIYGAYVDGRFPEEPLCELMAWCFAGWTPAEVTELARSVVRPDAFAARVHPELREIIDKAKPAGIDVVLVSASPYAVVVEAGRCAGFDEGAIVAARPALADGVLQPAALRPIPYADGKVVRLREHIGPSRIIYAAFGDNAFDVALLKSATVRVGVRPKARLRERASLVQGIVELAR